MNTIIIILSTILILVIAVLVYTCFSAKILNKRDTCIIVGLPNSGKTSLFGMVKTGKKLQTHTSLKPNEIILDHSGGNEYSKKSKFKLVDIPGHEKLRNNAFNRYSKDVKAIIFMVDAFTASRNIIKIGEYLYDILVHPSVQQNSIPILVVANKSDLATAISTTRLKTLLEQEIHEQRESRSSSHMESLGEEQQDEPSEFLGFENKKFEFEDLAPIDIQFMPLSLGSLPINEKDYPGFDLFQSSEVFEWIISHL